MFRGWVKSAGRNVWFWKRLPQHAGGQKILVSPSSYLRYWTHSLGQIHDDLISTLLRLIKPGNCVWDIGANVGVATFVAAHAVGPDGFVLSIDADVSLAERLRITQAANNASVVEVLPVAVADKIGVVKFNLSSYSTATNAIAGFGRFPGILRSVSMPSVTLDWLLTQFKAPNVVKIDVEGAEWFVLQGAHHLLQNARPTFIIEVGGDVSPEVTKLFQSARYDLHSMSDFAPIDRAVGDVVAIPRNQ